MKFILFFSIYLLGVTCDFHFKIQNSTIATKDSTIVPVVIVRNYLLKYLKNQTVFLSISSSSSSLQQRFLQDDMITSLLYDSEVRNISYNVVKDAIYQFRRRNRDVFNIMFIDELKSLE